MKHKRHIDLVLAANENLKLLMFGQECHRCRLLPRVVCKFLVLLFSSMFSYFRSFHCAGWLKAGPPATIYDCNTAFSIAALSCTATP